MRFNFMAFIVAGFTASAAFANPYSFSGDYRFTGVVEPVGRMTVDVVDARMPDAAKQVQTIESNGGYCQRVASSIRCTTMNHASSVPQSSLLKIHDKNVGLQVSFGTQTSPPSVITRGSTVVDWQISQPVQWAGGRADNYVYREMQGGISKLILPGTPEPLTLNSVDGQTLNKQETFVVTESRWRWHEDMASIVLTRSR